MKGEKELNKSDMFLVLLAIMTNVSVLERKVSEEIRCGKERERKKDEKRKREEKRR